MPYEELQLYNDFLGMETITEPRVYEDAKLVIDGCDLMRCSWEGGDFFDDISDLFMAEAGGPVSPSSM